MDKQFIPLLDLTRQYQSVQVEIETAVLDCLRSQKFILGPEVKRFEKEMADYIGAPYALGVSSGTDALLLSLMALGIEPGDEVITTPFTFVATAGAIARLGAKPVFVDIREDTFNLDENKVQRAISKKTKAIIPVHLFGQSCEMASLVKIAANYELHIIEDAAQSLGAAYNKKSVGNFGVTGCFSFFPTKNLGGAGDGGLVTTSDEKLFEKMKIIREHGANSKYNFTLLGGNFRLDVLQAVILSIKLKHLNNWTKARQKNAELYQHLLKNAAVQTPKVIAENESVFNQYCILSENRDTLKAHLQTSGVGTEIYYPTPMHLQESFKYLGYQKGDFPISESVSQKILALPIFPELREEEIQYVARSILEFGET